MTPIEKLKKDTKDMNNFQFCIRSYFKNQEKLVYKILNFKVKTTQKWAFYKVKLNIPDFKGLYFLKE